MPTRQNILVLIGICAAFLAQGNNILSNADQLKASAFNDKVELIVDGKNDPSWSTYYAENATATIEAEFLELEQFNAMNIVGYNLNSVEIEYSKDGTNWEKTNMIKGHEPFTYIAYLFDKTIECKKLKINLTGGAKKMNIRIAEMKFYTIEKPNKALFKPITETTENENKELNWRFPATLLVDGDLATKVNHWSGYTGSNIVINLLEKRTFSKVELLSFGVFENIEVLVSNDNKNFKTMKSYKPSKKDAVVEFDEVTAQYIKLILKGKTGATLKEIQVW